MSVAGKAQIARRPLLKVFVGAAAVAVAAAGAIEAPRFFVRRYPSSPFDDLLALLSDRENAARLGASWLSEHRTFDAEKLANALRHRLASRSLSGTLDSDLAAMRTAEADGWVLPETLVELCALAARAA
jgi:hypothetical protein